MPKKDPSIELAECLRVLAIQGEQAHELSQRAQTARQTAADLGRNSWPTAPSQDDRHYKAKFKRYTESLQACEQKLKALRAEAGATEAQLAKLQPIVTAAQKRAAELRQAIESERNSRVAEAVRRAAEAAPGRAEYFKERDRLTVIRAKVVVAELELDRLQANPPSKEDLSENRIKELLASGEFSEVQPQDASGLIKQLNRKVLEGHAAIRRQEDVVSHAQRRFCDETTSNLKALRNDIVGRIADGYGAALAATTEAGILRVAFNKETGDSNNLPCFVSPFIQDHQGAVSAWEQQIAKWRQQGYEI